MIIIREPTLFQTIRDEHSHFFETMVKGVVDLKQALIALDAEMHADLEQHLLEQGATQNDLWGFNLYFEGSEWIEFTSLINIRPAQGNRGMVVQDSERRNAIQEIVQTLIIR